MLRIHLLQQWYDLSDPAMEDALIEVPTMRRFAGIDMISDQIPDETTILTFRHLLEKHDLGQQIFEVVKTHLKVNGMAMKQGTIVETAKAHIRAKVEHPFRLIKRQFGFQKTRLRGLLKNRCKVNVLAALSNLFMARRRLLCST